MKLKSNIMIIMLFLCSVSVAIAQNQPSDLVINLQANMLPNHSIQLLWEANPFVAQYEVLRKLRNETNFSPIASNLASNITSFIDETAQQGVAYEYCVQSSTNSNVTGYVYAAEKLAPVHRSGRILLVVDNTYSNAASIEINEFKLDLIKEGWMVSSIFVNRSQTPVQVKSLINNEYSSHPNELKGIILLGHIAVPYSGKIAPDAHLDHVGAWPADIYYGHISTTEVDEGWKDETVNIVTSSDVRNHNMVGDGKFDVSNKSTLVKAHLFVSRVDVFNMPTISTDDVQMFKNYLSKNHSYRSGIRKFNNTSVIDDNFGFQDGEAFSQNGFRNFNALVGKNNVTKGDYFTSLKTSSSIWSYACGGGWNTGAAGVGGTSDFKANNIDGVFTMLFGSYFGDWDVKNNFLRAPIASPSSTLVSVWGGRPNWFFHTMSLGEPIGYSFLSSVNNVNTYFPQGFYYDKIHQSMQGDASLKMYVFDAPQNTFAVKDPFTNTMQISWSPAFDTEVNEYYVYRATAIDGDFELLNSTAIIGNQFQDNTVEAANGENYIYMVRASKLQHTPTGSFYNLSPGAIASQTIMGTPLPIEQLSFEAFNFNCKTNVLKWELLMDENIDKIIVERSDDEIHFSQIGNPLVQAKKTNYTWNDNDANDKSCYRLKIIMTNGDVHYSKVVIITKNIGLRNITCYPNPFTREISLTYHNDEEEQEITALLIDVKGTLIANQAYLAKEGKNNIAFTDLQNLANGIYFIQLFDATNTKLFAQIITK
jgi:hypothetical protein